MLAGAIAPPLRLLLHRRDELLLELLDSHPRRDHFAHETSRAAPVDCAFPRETSPPVKRGNRDVLAMNDHGISMTTQQRCRGTQAGSGSRSPNPRTRVEAPSFRLAHAALQEPRARKGIVGRSLRRLVSRAAGARAVQSEPRPRPINGLDFGSVILQHGLRDGSQLRGVDSGTQALHRSVLSRDDPALRASHLDRTRCRLSVRAPRARGRNLTPRRRLGGGRAGLPAQGRSSRPRCYCLEMGGEATAVLHDWLVKTPRDALRAAMMAEDGSIDA